MRSLESGETTYVFLKKLRNAKIELQKVCSILNVYRLPYVNEHKTYFSNTELSRVLFIILFRNNEVPVTGCKDL